MHPVVGVLAVQGDFREHITLLSSMGAQAMEVRSIADLHKCSALIIPGGESTAISKMMADSGLDAEIKSCVRNGMPFYGACAGAIVAAKKVLGEKRFKPLGLIDIEIARNAYGRQVDSFEAEVEFGQKAGARSQTGKMAKNPAGSAPPGKIKGVFIRAPVFKKLGRAVEVLATLDGKPVLARQDKVIAGTFHPEIAGEAVVHKMLLDLV